MIRFGWVLIVLRLVGLLMIGLAIPTVLGLGVQAIYIVGHWEEYQDPWWNFVYAVPSVLQGALGVYLLLGGRFFLKLCLRAVDSVCPGCAYDLSAVSGDRCPECGFRLHKEPDKPAQN